MKGKKSQAKYSSGTPAETHRRFLSDGVQISFRAVLMRLKRGKNLQALKYAEEIEKDKADERKGIQRAIESINKLTSEDENVNK